MARTKYIVDNLSGQTINGNVTINGNLSVTGVTTGNLATYKALLTDIGSQTGTSLNNFGGFNDGFIIGETYTIATYVSGDSFSNIANVTSGVIDTTGCVFIATGETPTNWDNGSTLVSSGNLVVTVLENNLGFDIEWIDDEFEFGPGFYVGFNSITGPLYNTFNRNSTFIQSGNVGIPFFGPTIVDTFIFPYNFNEKDDSIVLAVFDLSGPTPVSDSLYYYPVEIQILQDLDTTPIVISGTVESSFPINLTSIDLRCNGNYIQALYGDGTVNDMSELIIYLNSEPNISYLGTYSDAGDGGVLLEMPTNLVNQFCSNGTLTFEVFND
jgi:hypothetical protein